MPILAEQLGVTSLLTQGVWRRGLAKVSLAVGLAMSVTVVSAGTVVGQGAGQGEARFEPRRPAAVTGRVGADAPTHAAPPPVSTAVQVPAPAHLPAAPHDLMAQPSASPAESVGKDLGRVGRSASSTLTAKGGTAAGAAKQPVEAQVANRSVSRETTLLGKAKSPRSGMAPRERDGKARQALAPGARPTEQGKAAKSGRVTRHAAAPAQRSKAGQAVARTSRAPATVVAKSLSKAKPRNPATRTAAHAASRTGKATQAAKPQKHGASVRSAKATSSGNSAAASATIRRRGA